MASFRVVNAAAGNTLNVHAVSFNPHDNSQVCVVGNGVLKLLRYSEGSLKQIGFFKAENKVAYPGMMNYLELLHVELSLSSMVLGGPHRHWHLRGSSADIRCWRVEV